MVAQSGLYQLVVVVVEVDLLKAVIAEIFRIVREGENAHGSEYGAEPSFGRQSAASYTRCIEAYF